MSLDSAPDVRDVSEAEALVDASEPSDVSEASPVPDDVETPTVPLDDISSEAQAARLAIATTRR